MTDPAQITKRLDAVATFVGDAATRQDIRQLLNAAPDLARSLSRLVVGRGGPRDLAAIRDGIAAASEIADRLDALKSAPAEISEAAKALRQPDPALAQELGAALADELPLFKRDGGFVRAGYLSALDEACALRDESRKVIAQLQVGYADETGVRALKIRHNNVLGYFVEVTAQHGDKLMTAPLNARFIHRQTLAGQVRFTTTELGELEAKIANAADRALGLELETFEQALPPPSSRRATPSRRPPRRSPCSTSPARWQLWRSSATTCGPRSIRRWNSSSKAAGIPWSSR